MRRLLYIYVALLFVACSEGSTESPNTGEGRVEIALSSRSTAADSADDESRFEIPAELIPSEDQFSLTIEGSYTDPTTGEEMEYSQSFGSIEEYNTSGVDRTDGVTPTPPYLPAGDYTATIVGGGDAEGTIETESATNAIFGATVSFTVVARDLTAQLNINATLQNSIIRLEATDLFQSYYAGGSTLRLITEAGSQIEVTYPLSDDYTQEMLFVPAESKLYLEGEGVKQPTTGTATGTTVTFSKSYIGSTTACELATVIVDAATAGSTTITVTLDDTIDFTEKEDIDLNKQ